MMFFALVVFSTYDDVAPIINFTSLNVHNTSITCYSHHLCYHHQVNIVWYLNTSNGLHKFQADSELSRSEYGISTKSTCPATECQSTLSVPNDPALNGSVIWCGAHTEVCPDIQSTTNPVLIITNSCTSGI